ncbi:predicted protein [Nematostella vectensis]|uniref:Large subunit GTPase 1 homolog n=1 Tax=Nematostella vectensis TaxID=45351 RepID=A7S5J2_NEMVE|nr:predicted protein [Nematostella vectensis]|eukprot:XP_001633047.1 predicted protein [Nematostella vectensis]
MGKKNKSGLGNSLAKDRSRLSRGGRRSNDSWRHTSELNDGNDDNKFTISSITEQSDLDEFLASAQLAGTEFTAEKLNVTFVTPQYDTGVLSEEKVTNIKQAQEDNRQLLRIPRRPEWNKSMSAEELDLKERDSFVEWRRQLAILQEKDHIILTPFEKNLEFWRQLWRVIERSDVIVQIVDARNPELFRCEDLAVYVKEVNPLKANLLLINKADYLTPSQRLKWAEYYKSRNIQVAFWSALAENERLSEEQTDSTEEKKEKIDESEEDKDESEDEKDPSEQLSNLSIESGNTSEQNVSESLQSKTFCDGTTLKPQTDGVTCTEPGDVEGHVVEIDHEDEAHSGLVTSNKLIDMCQNIHRNAVADLPEDALTTIGLVGYPNVGKSSTINTILQSKKVAVSSTPGRTKHFQTLQLSPTVCLCDCPGLVFPSFVSTKAEMVVNGILPIDQMRDHIPPYVCHRIPRLVLEGIYGINIASPAEGEDPDRAPYAHELLNAYGYMRGYMTSSGTPDCPRSARYILKDYVNGKLLYCTPPPGEDAVVFQEGRHATGKYEDMDEVVRHRPSDPRKVRLHKPNVRCFTKGNDVTIRGRGEGVSSEGHIYKPWKKHNNKNKREKLRRLAKRQDNGV